MKNYLFAAAFLLFALGCGAKAKVLGEKPQGTVSSVLSVRSGDAPTKLTLQGKMVEKCPVAGCWFKLRDDSGEIKVDTKAAGFVVTDIPLNTLVTVGGAIQHVGDEPQIAASGLKY